MSVAATIPSAVMAPDPSPRPSPTEAVAVGAGGGFPADELDADGIAAIDLVDFAVCA